MRVELAAQANVSVSSGGRRGVFLGQSYNMLLGIVPGSFASDLGLLALPEVL